MLRQVLLLGFVMGSVVKTTEGYCQEDMIMQCLQPLTDHPFNDGAFFPNKTEAQLKAACVLFYEAKDCIKPLREDCETKIKITMDALVNMYTFICEESPDEFLKHSNCLSNPDLNMQAKKCNATAWRKIRTTLMREYETGRSDALKSEGCRIMDYLIKCVYDATNRVCGKDAANWAYKLIRITVKPIKSQLRCGAVDQTTLMVGIGVGIGCLVGLAICLIKVYNNYKLSRDIPYLSGSMTMEADDISYSENPPQYAAYPDHPPQGNLTKQTDEADRHQPNQIYQNGHQEALSAEATEVSEEHSDRTPLTI